MTTRALLLAAGRGSRLAPYTDDRPKCLVPLLGQPLLEHQIAALKAGGITDIAIVGGYRAECLRPYTDTLYVNNDWNNSNMVVSLTTAAEWMQAGPTLVCYTDIVYAAEAVRDLAASPADLAITFDPDWQHLWGARFENPLDDAETFLRTPQGDLAEIGQRAQTYERIHGQYMGLLKFTPAGWSTVGNYLAGLPREQVAKLDMTGLLARLLASGTRIATVPAPWPWAEADQPSDLALYENDGRFAALRAMLAAQQTPPQARQE